MKQNFPSVFEAATLAARLSERQRECLSLVREGLTSKEIGRTLSLSPSTVDNHLNTAIEKLGCSSRIVAARILEIAEQSGREVAAKNEGHINKIGSITSVGDGDRGDTRRRYILPPLGGPANKETMTRRVAHIALIAIAATMAFSAITITIAGVVELFSR